MQIDEDGMYQLLNATVKRAKLDVTNGNGKHAADAAEFLTDLAGDAADKMPDWYHAMKKQLDGMDELARRADALLNGKPAPKAAPKAAPAPAALTREEIQENARRLTDLGISPQWAAVQADPVKLAEHERLQARKDRADRLGVDWRYLED